MKGSTCLKHLHSLNNKFSFINKFSFHISKAIGKAISKINSNHKICSRQQLCLAFFPSCFLPVLPLFLIFFVKSCPPNLTTSLMGGNRKPRGSCGICQTADSTIANRSLVPQLLLLVRRDEKALQTQGKKKIL